MTNMLINFRDWLWGPYVEDTDINRDARLTIKVTLYFVVMSLLRILIFIIVGGALIEGISSLLFLLICIASFIAARSRFVRSGAWLLIGYLWLTSSIALYSLASVRNPAVVIYFLPIVTAGLLLDGRAALGLALGATLVFASAYYLIEQGQLIALPDNSLLAEDAFFRVVIPNFIILGALIYLFHQNFVEAMTQARRHETELRQNNQELQQVRISLEQEVTERIQRAELARLQAEAAQQVAEAQKWLEGGRAQLSEAMRGEQDIASLADNVIQQLCHYLEVPVGALFIIDNGLLQLAGSYGYMPTETHPQQFNLGEGLIGEAAAQKNTLLVDELPPNYLLVVGGTTEITPAYVLIHPFLYGEEVVGVIEIGNWSLFTSQQLSFLESVGENIAVAFQTAWSRSQMNDLLNQTRRQAEKLQAQAALLQAWEQERTKPEAWPEEKL